MKKVAPKLVLRRETLRALSVAHAEQVRGGVVGNSEGTNCPLAVVVVVVAANTVG